MDFCTDVESVIEEFEIDERDVGLAIEEAGITGPHPLVSNIGIISWYVNYYIYSVVLISNHFIEIKKIKSEMSSILYF